ncbi:MAG: hypothetical protein NT002_03665 [candidate division Zixibacteria bacterium]|nr:hypothetical protein [candidate division Zixibacteria bacterium]
MDTLEKLEERINKALNLIEKLTEGNKVLKVENENLKSELIGVKSKMAQMESLELERSDKIKTKLNSILNKLENLEQV